VLRGAPLEIIPLDHLPHAVQCAINVHLAPVSSRFVAVVLNNTPLQVLPQLDRSVSGALCAFLAELVREKDHTNREAVTGALWARCAGGVLDAVLMVPIPVHSSSERA
jgi:hypothetical protein